MRGARACSLVDGTGMVGLVLGRAIQSWEDGVEMGTIFILGLMSLKLFGEG